jgi:hypothetical protein
LKAQRKENELTIVSFMEDEDDPSSKLTTVVFCNLCD